MIRLAAVFTIVVVCCADLRGEDSPVSFLNEVQAVLSKSGCNSGACHGNLNGKGGFKLSLRGEDAQFDFEKLVHQYGGRRIDTIAPEQSLILLKPTGQVAHQGGQRFAADSQEYRLLRDWIAQGAPGPGDQELQLISLEVRPQQAFVEADADNVQLKAVARFDDGSQRDVTHLCVVELSHPLVAEVRSPATVYRRQAGEVTAVVRYLNQQVPVPLAFLPDRPEFVWKDVAETNFVDGYVFAKAKKLRLLPSPLTDDSTFVRRAYLDALGVLPTEKEARAFVADRRADKRSRLIDTLLARPEFAQHWALKWSDLLRNEEKVLDKTGVEKFHEWIRQNIENEVPVDQFVHALLSSRGSTYKDPATNFYRANRTPTARSETAAQLFLGTRLQCAQCHNHPFDRWTQDDYYSWAAVFARIEYKIVDNQRRDKLDKHEFVGEQIVQDAEKGEVKHPRTGASAKPKLLGGASLDESADRLTKMADWMTSAKNRQFVRTQVNWVWYHLMGRGLVDPVDDFRSTNPPSHPRLLEHLADDFVQHDLQLRHLVRRIMNSRTYQLSAIANPTNVDDQVNYTRAIVKRLTAEQLLDAQCKVLDVHAEFAGFERVLRAGEMPGAVRAGRRAAPMDGDRFLTMFGKPQRLLACECERSNQTTLAQAFLLISGEGLQQRIARKGNRIDQLLRSPQTTDQRIESLYWTALSRGPTDEELRVIRRLFQTSQSPELNERQQALANLLQQMGWHPLDKLDRQTMEDVVWSLVNSKEFIFRH